MRCHSNNREMYSSIDRVIRQARFASRVTFFRAGMSKRLHLQPGRPASAIFRRGAFFKTRCQYRNFGQFSATKFGTFFRPQLTAKICNFPRPQKVIHTLHRFLHSPQSPILSASPQNLLIHSSARKRSSLSSESADYGRHNAFRHNFTRSADAKNANAGALACSLHFSLFQMRGGSEIGIVA